MIDQAEAERRAPVTKEWRFIRYRTDQYGNRVRMAEGAKVHAYTEQAAREKARRLFADCPLDEFELRADVAAEIRGIKGE